MKTIFYEPFKNYNTSKKIKGKDINKMAELATPNCCSSIESLKNKQKLLEPTLLELYKRSKFYNTKQTLFFLKKKNNLKMFL